MLFTKSKGIDAEEFWRIREEELGTPVLGRALGRVMREESKFPVWGLLYTTGRAVYFQTFESENWMSMLFAGGRGGSRSKNEIIEIPVEDITRFEAVRQGRSFLGLLRKPPIINLTWTSKDSGDEQTLLMEIDGNPEKFVGTLPR